MGIKLKDMLKKGKKKKKNGVCVLTSNLGAHIPPHSG